MHKFSYNLLCFTLGLLPAGFIFGVPLTQLLFLLFLFISIIVLFNRYRVNKYQIYTTILILLFLILLLILLLKSLTSPSIIDFVALNQFNGLLMFLMFFFAIFVLSDNGDCRYIIYGYFFLCLIKFITYILILLFDLNLKVFIEPIFTLVFTTPPVTAQYSIFLSRIQFQNDFLVIPVITYILFSNSSSLVFKRTMLLIFTLSGLISYSRFFMLCLLLVFFVYLLVYIKSNATRKILYLLIPTFLLLIANYQERLTEFVVKRFTSSDSITSTNERFIQLNKLVSYINDDVFGQGLGFFIHDYIRSEVALYSYEIQLMSMTMQLGIFSMLIYFLLIASPLYRYKRSYNFPIPFVMFILLVFVSLTNPLLTNFSFIAAIIVFSSLLKDRIKYD